jgi:hypothetical protein
MTAAYWPVVIRNADVDAPTPRIFQDHYPNLNPPATRRSMTAPRAGRNAVQPPCGIRRAPFPDLSNRWSLAVDDKGTVHVTDSGSNQVLTLAGGGGASTGLPFAGLASPAAVGVDDGQRLPGIPSVEAAGAMKETSTRLEPTGWDVALLGQVHVQKITFHGINGAGRSGPAYDPSLLGADWENEYEQQSIRRRRW